MTILEIKATDWDKIRPHNIKKNANQLLRYVEKCIVIDKVDVCLGIIYPRPPQKHGLRKVIESYLEHYGTPAYWFNETKTINL